ncbi:predicted protein [Thalassiosira pseudonana CCMP1335]|uniref:Uncharacterized protein n=1 Tax=Thalassiosira pseudonana TaxID=35128 RepID=B8C9R7_THAPS|nr:predicted protein [Thalassiosira pseudonana CCMP1335]EED89906.1 predicted protein [Thalassiosira pseudonana CCMP1335]
MSLSFQLSSSSLTDGDELEMHCKGERGDEQQIEDEPIARVVPARGVELPHDWDAALELVDDEELGNDISNSSNSTVPIEFKLQLAIESLSRMNNLLETRKEASNRLITTLKVMLNETDLRIGDVQRDVRKGRETRAILGEQAE